MLHFSLYPLFFYPHRLKRYKSSSAPGHHSRFGFSSHIQLFIWCACRVGGQSIFTKTLSQDMFLNCNTSNKKHLTLTLLQTPGLVLSCFFLTFLLSEMGHSMLSNFSELVTSHMTEQSNFSFLQEKDNHAISTRCALILNTSLHHGYLVLFIFIISSWSAWGCLGKQPGKIK